MTLPASLTIADLLYLLSLANEQAEVESLFGCARRIKPWLKMAEDISNELRERFEAEDERRLLEAA